MAPPRRNIDMLSSMFSGIMGGGPAGDKVEPAAVVKQLPKPAETERPKSDGKPGVPSTSEADELMDDEMD